MKYAYDKVGNYISAFDQDNEELIRQQLGEDIFITDEDLGQKAIVEGDLIRAETRVDRVLAGREDLFHGEYMEDNEIKYKEKPSNFHFWDKNTNEWIYDQELEISVLEEELGSLELEIYNKQNEMKKLKEDNKTFAAKKLEKEVAELENKFNEKMKRYEELEG